MTAQTFLDGRVTLHCGDCLDVLASMPENSVDSVVCDPPYHLTSIVKRFGNTSEADNTKTSERSRNRSDGYARLAAGGFMGKQWDGGDIAFQPSTWAAVLRVLKPGGYLLAFASTRGFGRMSVAIEDAGFITHPLIAWVFGSGFPKATRIKAEGYDGFRYGGQALKPAIEPIYMGQKPFAKGLSGTENILAYGAGAVNIDGCRIEAGDGYTDNAVTQGINTAQTSYAPAVARRTFEPSQSGRWPANLIHDGSEEVLAAFPAQTSVTGKRTTASQEAEVEGTNWLSSNHKSVEHHDSGSAARFFYQAKADADDRIASRHPTVKPLDLMQYLVRLVTPPRGTVLDPFAGTGTTGEAAWRENLTAILIERETEYQADIARRMDLATKPSKRAAIVAGKGKLQGAEGLPLFNGDAA